MERFTYKLAGFLASTGYIKESDIELCRYGLELFITSVFEVAAILAAALAVGNFIETVLFLLAFLPVRIYGGGYHADTRLRCFLILVFVYILFSIVLHFELMLQYKYCMAAFTVLDLAAVCAWAPASGKKMSSQEKRFYRRVSITSAALELILVISACVFGFYDLHIYIIALGALTAFISITAGKLKSVIKKQSA